MNDIVSVFGRSLRSPLMMLKFVECGLLLSRARERDDNKQSKKFEQCILRLCFFYAFQWKFRIQTVKEQCKTIKYFFTDPFSRCLHKGKFLVYILKCFLSVIYVASIRVYRKYCGEYRTDINIGLMCAILQSNTSFDFPKKKILLATMILQLCALTFERFGHVCELQTLN